MNRLTEMAGPADAGLDRIIKLAILAVGGQGGGVLTAWIEAVARAQGWHVQATSVAGVAQRTGATIYYVEMAPAAGEAAPVFSLSPAAGDVDVLIAAEMMEAGRAIQRGFVTPDRTTLVASTHRALAVSEKVVPGNGIASAEDVRAAAEVAAQRLIMADMDRLAVEQGSVISASLFGALAGSGALPFPRAAFEDAIQASGKAVETSLRAFAAGFDSADRTARDDGPSVDAKAPMPLATGPASQLKVWADLEGRIAAYPEPVAAMAGAGLRKVVDFQSPAYGAEYLDHLDRLFALDRADQDYSLATEGAKYVANAMAYDDIIRVADLKTRASRFARIRDEMTVGDDTVLQLTEFLHPRAEEIAGLMPARIGARIEASPKWMARLDRWFNRGRRMRTDGLRAFLMLHLVGGLQHYRLRTHRHAIETAHLTRWLDRVHVTVPTDYALAVEILRCRRLIKGYSDTHARGLSKFDKVLGALSLIAGRDDAAEWAGRLRDAALQDPEGAALDGAIKTIRSFTSPTPAST